MDKKVQIGIIIIVILALLAGYFALSPHYKQIEMSGYKFEVPESNAEVKNNSINYNTYVDTEKDLNIKTWACIDNNDINGTINASTDFTTHLGENMGTNTTYKNISLYNKSGTYTYYEADAENSCMIIITSKDLKTIEHILETIKKPQYKINTDQFNMTGTGLEINNQNDTENTTAQTTTKSTSAKKTSSKSGSSSNDGYRWSEQYGDYIKEYTDSNGVQHIDSKKGYKSSYNPRTNEFKEQNYEKLL